MGAGSSGPSLGTAVRFIIAAHREPITRSPGRQLKHYHYHHHPIVFYTNNNHHQPINVPTAGAQALLMDYT
jgi:hypothetical protein